SAGSACEAGSDVPGSALLASGVSAADALHAVRISLHRFSTEADVRTLLASLDLIVPALRQAYGAAVPDAEGPTSDGDTS
ncbi:cysteine desulfurase NifS, partial [Candidatus Woesearchaeota archaeon CG_4_10_14_0_2_um_filter_57_5]